MVKVYRGTEIKLNVNITGGGFTSMKDIDFQLELYVSGGSKVTKNKADCIYREEDDSYIVTLDTAQLGKVGKLILKCTAYITDPDFEDKTRTEVSCIDTDVMILKEL